MLYINYINLKEKAGRLEMVVTWARLLDKVEVLKRGKQRTQGTEMYTGPEQKTHETVKFRKKKLFLSQL